MLVTGRSTLSRGSDLRAIEEIARFCKEEEIEAIVIGIPRSPEGVESPLATRIRSFARKLARETGLPLGTKKPSSWGPARNSLQREVDRAARDPFDGLFAHVSGRPLERDSAGLATLLLFLRWPRPTSSSVQAPEPGQPCSGSHVFRWGPDLNLPPAGAGGCSTASGGDLLPSLPSVDATSERANRFTRPMPVDDVING